MSTPFCLFSRGLALGGMCEVLLGVVDVACGDAHEIATQLDSFCCPGFLTAIGGQRG